MSAYGNVTGAGDAFAVTAKGRRVASVVTGIKSVWRLGSGG
jgi:hypothetical protein